MNRKKIFLQQQKKNKKNKQTNSLVHLSLFQFLFFIM